MLYRTVHAQRRAQERLGFSPTEAQWAETVAAILDAAAGVGGAALLQARTYDAERWRVKLAGRDISAVYSPETARIITVTSSDMTLSKHLIRRYGKSPR
jgi:hypothetical protein